MVLLDCDFASAAVLLDRVRKWVFGDYTIAIEGEAEKAKIWVSAAIGIAEWQPGEPVQQLIERADKAMYLEKTRSSQATGRPPSLTGVGAQSNQRHGTPYKQPLSPTAGRAKASDDILA